MELFWVDQSCIRGNITAFENIARSWPKLISLDLYSNRMRAETLPPSFLADVPQLRQFQLQQNDIRASVPHEWWRELQSRPDLIFNAQLNPQFDTAMPPWYMPSNNSAHIFTLGTLNKVETNATSSSLTKDSAVTNDSAAQSGEEENASCAAHIEHHTESG